MSGKKEIELILFLESSELFPNLFSLDTRWHHRIALCGVCCHHLCPETDLSKMDLVNQPVVIDNGSGTIKAGFAGGQVPKSVFPNLVGRPKHVRVMAGGLEGDTFIGSKAEEHRGLMSLKYPMEHGIVTDWNEMERIWHYIYSKEQLQTFPEEHPVLLTGKLMNCSSE